MIKFSLVSVLALIVGLWTILAIMHAPSSNQQTATSSFENRTANSLLKLNLEEVSRHANANDCWTIIGANVYDITPYLRIHPGGPVISEACGINGTELFMTKGGVGRAHSTSAEKLLKDFLLGPYNTQITGEGLNASIDSPEILKVIQDALKNFRNPVVEAYQMILFSEGKYYLVSYQDGNLVIREGVHALDNSLASELNANSTTSTSGLTLAAVATHNSLSSCWIIISGNVYDVTSYLSIHPGGVAMIQSNCGTDATSAFATKGGTGGTHSASAMNLLNTYLIGSVQTTTSTNSPLTFTILSPSMAQAFPSSTTQVSLSVSSSQNAQCKWNWSDNSYALMPYSLSSSDGRLHSGSVSGLASNRTYQLVVRCAYSNGTSPGGAVSVSFSVAAPTNSAPSSGYTLADVSTHNSASSCWLAINNRVYDVTSYLNIHPGGRNRILNDCGQDASVDFNTRGGTGGHSSNAQNLLEGFYIGNVTGGSGSNSTGNTGTNSTGGIPTVEQAIQQRYPGATILEINVHDNGRKEVQIRYNGQERTVWLDSQNRFING